MSETQPFDFSKRFSPRRKKEFAKILLDLQDIIGMKVSSRGWAYILEGKRYINKNQFDRVQDAINDLRRTGDLPVDFVAEDGARMFDHLNKPYEPEMGSLISDHISRVTEGHDWYTPDYWVDTDHFVQVIVEKVDLVTLFEPLCRSMRIPIANARGWSSIHQRAEYARRFKQAEADGKTCVLLYCGDHDPDGLRISDTLRANLEQIKQIRWSDGVQGYDPENLIIKRFGLEYDFIERHGLTWIDNLITGNTAKKMDLSDKRHPNHYLPYVQQYLKKVGARKCEANALIVVPKAAQRLFKDAVNEFIDVDAFQLSQKAMHKDAEVRYNEALDELSVDLTDVIEIDRYNPDDIQYKIKVRSFINTATEQL